MINAFLIIFLKNKALGPRDPIYTALPEDDSNLDVTSPRDRDVGGSKVDGSTDRDPSSQRRKDKAKAKDDEKQEKRRLKEEERAKREREKEKERERKRNLKSSKDGNKKEKAVPTLEDVVQAEGRPIPLFLEKCVKFIEEEGLDSEGIYRVPGNRAHVDILFQKLEEGLF